MASYIVFEGPDFAGKSSLIAFIAEQLQARDVEVEVVREPGGTPFAEAMRESVLCGEYSPSHEAELFAMLAARADLFAKRILPALEAGKVVLGDRGSPSTDIYQCGNDDVLRDMFLRYKKIAAPITPLYVFLELDYETYLERRNARTDAGQKLDAIEKRYTERPKYEALMSSYRQAAAREQNVLIVNVVGKTVEQIHHELWPYLCCEAQLSVGGPCESDPE